MTHVSLAHRARLHPSAITSAALSALNSHRVHPNITAAAPKAEITVAAPMPAVCVDAAAKNAALCPLAGSTMNSRSVNKAAAKKVLATTKAHAGQGAAKKTGAGLTHVSHHLAQTGAAGTKHGRAWMSC